LCAEIIDYFFVSVAIIARTITGSVTTTVQFCRVGRCKLSYRLWQCEHY